MSENNTNLVPFGSYSPDKAREERKGLDEDSTGEFVKLKEGRHQLRILPPPEGQDSPFVIVHQHYIRVRGEDKPIVFVCPRMASKGKKPCLACKKADELYRSSNPMDRRAGSALFPKRRVFCNVINRANPDDGSKPWAFGFQIHDQLVGYAEDEDDPIDFTHPIEGYDVVVKRKGTGKEDTKYKVILPRHPSKLAEEVEEMNDLITGQRDLTRYATIPNEDEIRKMMAGERPTRGELSSDNKRDEEERGGRRRRTASDDVVDAEFVDDEDDDF